MTRPTQDLLRTLTDEHVLRALMDHRRLTRAELAAIIGISKPTATESVRRLTDLGLVADTGERTPGGRGRGRVGSYYALSNTVGTALAVSIAPDGVAAEAVDSYGDVVARSDGLGGTAGLPETIRSVAGAVTKGGPARLAVVSVADPVDRRTGRAVCLPDSPFLVGDLDPVELLGPFVAGPVVVDNDVNWAAQAERRAFPGLDDFAYVHLGEGLGCAIVSDGNVLRGNAGTAGEIAHLITAGPDGRAMPFTEVFATLGLRQAGTAAIDVSRLLAADPAPLARAVSGVLAASLALVDPAVVVIGGTWGPALLGPIAAEFARQPRHVPVRAARVVGEPALAGTREHAVDLLRAAVADLTRGG